MGNSRKRPWYAGPYKPHLAHEVEVVTDPLLQGRRSTMEIIGPPRQHHNLQLHLR